MAMTVWRLQTLSISKDSTMHLQLWWESLRRSTWWPRKVTTHPRIISTSTIWRVTASQVQSTTSTLLCSSSRTTQSAICRTMTTARLWGVPKTQSSLLSWLRGVARNSNAFLCLWTRWSSATSFTQFKPKRDSNGAKIIDKMCNSWSMMSQRAQSQRD